MTADEIRQLQARLAEMGFDPGPVDGLMGPRTEAAVVAFKASVGLRPRPYVGPITWSALMTPAPDTQIPWMSEAVRMKGLHESRDTATLKQWFDRSVAWIDPRDIAWCGAFVATVMRKYDPRIALPENPLGARNWGQFGVPCDPQLGAVLTFWRGTRNGWRGHVGLYWGEDDTAYHVLGGNQSDAVTVARVAKSRLLTARWPIEAKQPRITVRLSQSGQPLSTNEA